MRNDSYRVKSRVSFGAIMVRIVIAAVILLVASLILLYVFGVRYISTTTDDGLEIKFFGVVNSDGSPKRGVLRYSDGTLRR